MQILYAFQLEWLKMKHYRVFWILLIMYLAALLVISSGGVFFLEWLKSKGADFSGLDPTMIPIYDFPDIWQNITWLSAFFKLFPAFIMIISVNNDLTYNTLRQNVIDGISKRDYLLSKVALTLFLALVSTAFLALIGFITGMIYANPISRGYMLTDIEFLFAFGYEVFAFCMLSFLVSLVIKKSGFAIVALFLYTIMFEPILGSFLAYFPPIKDATEWIVDFLPAMSIYKLISIPFPRYFLQEIKDYIDFKQFMIVTGWIVVYTTLIFQILVRKDVKG